MRSKLGHGDEALERALSDLTSALNATGVPWMVIGGIAVIARGVRRMTFGSVEAPMASSEALIVFKAIAGRPKDLEDAIGLLGLYRDIDRARLREHVKQLAELADDPGLVSGLETAIATSARAPLPRREARPRRTSGTKRKPRSGRVSVSKSKKSR